MDEISQIKEYIRENKLFIEIMVGVAAITALFLNIPNPENLKTLNYLLNIKFSLLLVFTLLFLVGVTFFCIKLYLIHEKNKEKMNPMYEAVTYFLFLMPIFIISTNLIMDLWLFLFGMYKDQLIDFLSMMSVSISMTITLFWFLLMIKLERYFNIDIFNEKLIRYGYLVICINFFSNLLSYLIKQKQISPLYLFSFIGTTLLLLMVGLFILFVKKRSKN